MARAVSGVDREIVSQRDGINCHFCLKVTIQGKGSSKLKRRRTIDHVVPVSWGGKNKLSNYVIACAGCNEEKGNKLFYCRCKKCINLVKQFMMTETYRERVDFLKPKVVRKQPTTSKPRHMWKVEFFGCEKSFITYREALAFALMQSGGRLTPKRR